MILLTKNKEDASVFHDSAIASWIIHNLQSNKKWSKAVILKENLYFPLDSYERYFIVIEKDDYILYAKVTNHEVVCEELDEEKKRPHM